MGSTFQGQIAGQAVQQGTDRTVQLIREAIRKFVESMQQPHTRLPLFYSENPTLAERVGEELHGFGW